MRKPIRHHNNQIEHSAMAEQTTWRHNNERQQQDPVATTLRQLPSNTNGNRDIV
ncbi:hypothetical protein A2U01_0118772 [Trifolium medium]|uniref:Uncharacterized protein n=1 Tax=Trifolium medium TaxID=97028 RepID=A0A392WF45_9FABA|nr:hypothetical protein [Trifolium medium]